MHNNLLNCFFYTKVNFLFISTDSVVCMSCIVIHANNFFSNLSVACYFFRRFFGLLKVKFSVFIMLGERRRMNNKAIQKQKLKAVKIVYKTCLLKFTTSNGFLIFFLLFSSTKNSGFLLSHPILFFLSLFFTAASETIA